MDRYLRVIPWFFTICVPLYSFSPLSWRISDVFYSYRLSADVETFRTALEEARTAAMKRGQVVGVEVGRKGWEIYLDIGTLPWGRDTRDQSISASLWHPQVYVGTNIRTFFFDARGRCLSAPNCPCIPESWDPMAPVANLVTITSDAHRIYTVLFTPNGAPIVERDDF
jgi:hypothetical protein